MAFQQHHQQQRYYTTVETGGKMHMSSQQYTNPRKRKFHIMGQPADAPHYCTSEGRGTARETETRQFEIEAYTAVLRAFKIQADFISWERESLITNLRQELRLSNDEHREVLHMINMEDCYQGIRELCQASGDQHGAIGASNTRYNIVSQRKQSKKHSAAPHQSFGSSSAFYKQSSLTAGRKLLKVKKHGSVAKGLTNPVRYPSSGPNEMGKTVFGVSSNICMNKTSELAKHNYLLGKKVKTRLPHDPNFYDAVISRYDPSRGLHALSFDFAPGNDSLQWVDLTNIPPGDIQLDNDDPILTTLPQSFRPRGTNTSLAPEIYSACAGKGIRIRKSRPISEFLKARGGSGHNKSETKIRMTDDLLESVKRVFSTGNLDPYTIGDAKEVLKEHEQALIQVLESLEDISDDG